MNYNKMFRVFDNGGDTADRYTAFLRDNPEDGALGMSDNPTHPQGFSQWGDFDVDVVEANNQELRFDELPTNIQKHIIDRFEVTETVTNDECGQCEQCECVDCTGDCECSCTECAEKGKLMEQWKEVVLSMLSDSRGDAADGIKKLITRKVNSLIYPSTINEFNSGAIKIIGDDVLVNNKKVGVIVNDLDDFEHGIVLKLSTGEEHDFTKMDELYGFLIDTFRIKEFTDGPIQLKGDSVYVNGKNVGNVTVNLDNEKTGIKLLLKGGEGYEFETMPRLYKFLQGKFNLREDYCKIINEATTEQKYVVAALRQLAKKLDIKQPRFRSLNGKSGFVEMSPKDWENESIPNGLREKAVTKIFHAIPRNFSDVDYGNVNKRSITLTTPQWVELLQYYGIDGKPAAPVEPESTEPMSADSMTEGKQDFTTFHDSYSSAISDALSMAQRRGFGVDMDDVHDKISSGPRKPGVGETNSFIIGLTKNGDPTRRTLAIQVYGMDSGNYELNTYIS